MTTCPFPDCPNPEIPETFPKTQLRREVSSGWVIMPGARKGGGVNAVELVEYTGRVAHARCVDRAKRGLVGQQAMWSG